MDGSDIERAISLMNQRTAHRGLRSKQWTWGPTHVGFVRLPIQGLGEEHDPPCDIPPAFSGALVGEVFNFRELDPRAECDLPVVTKLVGNVGEEAFRVLDGFWQFACYDRTRRRIHVYTDILGKKPLYVRRDRMALSSEIRALELLGPTTIDEWYFAHVHKFGYPLSDRTPWQEIRKIPPMTCVTYEQDSQSLTMRKYDELVPTSGNLRTSVEEAVQRRMVSDVPVACLVSGGLDSTIVYMLARRHGDVAGYHVRNEEDHFAALLPDVSVIDGSSGTLYESLVANEGPVDLGSVQPQYQLAKALRAADCRVALSGDGADELFGGYRRAAKYDSQPSDVHDELVNYHLPRLDKLMMSQTVELRCPFLARSVVEAALALPWSMRRHKEALRETFSDVVPQEIKAREKAPLRAARYREDRGAHRDACVERYRERMSAHQATKRT